MKIGDTYDVTIAGSKVTEARVTYMEDGIAELVFEGKRVKMSYTTNLAPEATAPVDAPIQEPSTQTIVTGVDRRDADGNVVLSTGEANRSESAPVGEQTNPTTVDVAQAAQTVTPVVESGPATLATPVGSADATPEAAVTPESGAEKPAAPEAQ